MKTALAILALLLAAFMTLQRGGNKIWEPVFAKAAPAQDKPQWCASASLIWDGTVATLVCIDRHGNMTKVRDFPIRWLPNGRSEVRIDLGEAR